MIIIGHSRGVFFSDNIFNHFAFFQGVSFFFVLSGFILTIVYPTLPKHQIKQFYLARFARIWPAHIAALIFFLMLLHNKLPATISQLIILITNITLIQGWIPDIDYYFSFNAPSWSISTEAFFYLCFPLLILRWRQTWPYKLFIIFKRCDFINHLLQFCQFSGNNNSARYTWLDVYQSAVTNI